MRPELPDSPGPAEADGGHPTAGAALPADAAHFRRCLGMFATGVTVVTTRSGDGGFVGLTANSFSSLSLSPPLVLWSLNRGSRSLADFRAASHFAVSVLSAGQADLARRFASPQINRFAGIAVHAGMGGAPLVDGAIAWFECETRSHHEYGDHRLFIGEVKRCAWVPGEPLVFAQGTLANLGAPGSG